MSSIRITINSDYLDAEDLIDLVKTNNLKDIECIDELAILIEIPDGEGGVIRIKRE